ncbi:MAG: hypothetical protein P2A85_17990 [Microcoleus anatoxicus]|uniref:hypothetical protein n=1 Tax=Microcoleus anatoxicus TaxID=2705319 RepID=UPI00366E40A4
MAKKKQPRSLEMAAGMPNQHLNKLGVALMDDNIVNVFSEIFNKFKPRGCIVCDRSKNSREYAKTKIPIKKEIKMLKIHGLVLEKRDYLKQLADK